ncbi:unnamed protein product [Acanthoscelides obtectus]|uniref:HTH CENPB-type domain-containing protein n=1 Tax=Acanthoscelides obtectus TaxID=200917 RepID=A0A9P0L9L8_ACAOB|nr:unnamed protein product [Acanthoscelides obtectus]CAK1671792.1 hypothetical protein AOBTE_LOCUS28464 [Acanthoscelides obtectus]
MERAEKGASSSLSTSSFSPSTTTLDAAADVEGSELNGNMLRNYKRTSNRQARSQEAMKIAIEAVKEKKWVGFWLLKTFKVPQATLRRHALEQNKTVAPAAKGLGRFQLTFPLEIERQLVEHIKLLETRMFGLTRTMVQELAFELAEKNGFSHRFNKDKGKASQEWLDGFLKRHKDISLRKPEPTSAARVQDFNRPQVRKFFDNYQEYIHKHKLNANQIYNVDESGLSTVQRPQKILATAGRKQVGAITCAERGSNVTVDQNLPSLPIEPEAGEIMTQEQNKAPESSSKPSTSSCKPSDSSDAIAVTNDIHNTVTGPLDISQPSTSSFASTSSLAIPVNVISPVPSGKFVSRQGKRKSNNRTTTFLLTSSPNMAELKYKREIAAEKPTRKRKQAVTKSLYIDDDSDEERSDQEDEEDDCACIYCNDLYSRSKPGEGWLGAGGAVVGFTQSLLICQSVPKYGMDKTHFS